MMRLLIPTLLLLGCSPTVSEFVDAGNGDTPDSGGNGDDCAAGTSESIFVIDLNFQLLRYLPNVNQFQSIGTVNCPGAGQETPFSMSVDRQGSAWVLYSDGTLYNVSTETAACQATTFPKNQQGFDLFGMGFVADSSGSTSETLYISKANDGLGDSTLGRLDKASLAVSSIGPLSSIAEYSPELTGTGAGELYGYYPGSFGSEVQQINKQSGQTTRSWQSEGIFDITAWAFAHFGGQFYIFRSDTFSNEVVKFDPMTGNEQVVATSPYEIVGAGVSTCAPINPD